MDNIQSPLFVKSLVDRFKLVYRSLSPERVFFVCTLLFLSTIFFFSALVVFNSKFLIASPTYGGSITEGIVGTPRFINPVLATSDQDKDLVSLIFAGLTKHIDKDLTELDMAESISESDDKLQYSIKLKSNLKFHDGQNLTSDDVAYTISLIQNPSIKSPHRIEWEGVTFEKKSDLEFMLTLKKPYPHFMTALTIGILPKHLWKLLTDEQIILSDYNVHAIGSGPYFIDTISTNSGIPTTFTLKANKRYSRGYPYITKITLMTFQNEKYLVKAFLDKDIDRIHGIGPEKISSLGVSTSSIDTSSLPRTFAVFFNPNKKVILSDKNVRNALRLAIDKEGIVTEVLHKYGKTINSPYPFDDTPTLVSYNPDEAIKLLKTNKAFQKASSTFSITLTTTNNEEMKMTAEIIKKNWEAIGVQTNIEQYDVSDLNQNIIKDRDFEALLFGTITQTPSDLYAFWHSSQRTYPGLNISNYVSKKLDANLDVLRSSEDSNEQISAYNDLKKEFEDEVPGIFLFTPSLIYVTRDRATSPLPHVSYDNSSRFNFVQSWFIYENKIWPMAYKKNIIDFLGKVIY